MEQLKKAYEAIEMLQALNLPVSDEQMKAIEKLEKEYLQDEIIPLLKQEMEPMTEKINGNFCIEVTYDRENGLKMNIMENENPRSTSSVSDKTELSTRDTTKYSIDGGEPLKKRRFVLAVVKRYVETHPDITYEELRQIFPDRLSHSSTYGVFRPYNDIFEKLYDQPDLRKRFFLEKDDLIELADGTLLTVYNQWGRHFPYFLEVAKQLHNVESFSNDGWQNVERDG